MVDWTYDELVLAADLVSRNGWTGVRANSPQALDLSALLRNGQLHQGVDLPPDFRTPASIQRKTYDLATADATYPGRPTRGGKLAGPVLQEFHDDLDAMQAKAAAIREVLLAGEILPHAPDTHPDDETAAHEGGILEYLARRRERDKGLRNKKLAAVLAAGGSIACESCGFDFGAVYGERGTGYIEVHHVLPLHASGPVKTTPDDLALLCANCHRMCHRGTWITPAEVADLVAAGKADTQ